MVRKAIPEGIAFFHILTIKMRVRSPANSVSAGSADRLAPALRCPHCANEAVRRCSKPIKLLHVNCGERGKISYRFALTDAAKRNAVELTLIFPGQLPLSGSECGLRKTVIGKTERP